MTYWIRGVYVPLNDLTGRCRTRQFPLLLFWNDGKAKGVEVRLFVSSKFFNIVS